MLKNGENSKFKDDILQMAGILGFPGGDINLRDDKKGIVIGFDVVSADNRVLKEIRSQKDFDSFVNYNPLKPLESKVKRKLAEDQAKKSGKYSTISAIKGLTDAQRGGLSITEYMKYLQSQNYLIGEE